MLGDGFYVLENAIPKELADRVLAKTMAIEKAMLDKDPFFLGNRGARRYSLGSAQKTHHLVHEEEWVELLNVKKLHDLIDSIGDYMVVGGGGDIVLNYTDTHQWLHTDLPREEMYHNRQPPAIAVNFAIHDVECNQGSIRLYPGTQQLLFNTVTVKKEIADTEGRVKFVCPMKKGDALIRDLRVWHAGSANLAGQTRYFPNIEFLAQWFADATKEYGDHLSPRAILPQKSFNKLNPYAQKKARQILAPDNLDVGLLPDIVLPQPSG